MSPYRKPAVMPPVPPARRWGATWWVKFVVGTLNGERSRIRRELRHTREREAWDRSRREAEAAYRLACKAYDRAEQLWRTEVACAPDPVAFLAANRHRRPRPPAIPVGGPMRPVWS